MWQSFAAIGRGTSEIRLPKEKTSRAEYKPVRTAVPGGLIKHAIKLKTSPARLVAQLLQPSLAFCCSLQPMTAYVPSSPGRYAVIGCKLQQNANIGCNSCASFAGLILCFIASFILGLLVIAPLFLWISGRRWKAILGRCKSNRVRYSASMHF